MEEIKKVYYVIWDNMVQRCKSHINYTDIIVCEEWLNFSNFVKWVEDNYNHETMEGWHLDKDILVKGNKTYSPETCCFVPQERNKTFTTKKRGVCLGVVSVGKKFRSVISIKGVQKHLGYFKTYQEAFQAYKIAKELHIKQLAEKYKQCLKIEVYKSLINYQVEITD